VIRSGDVQGRRRDDRRGAQLKAGEYEVSLAAPRCAGPGRHPRRQGGAPLLVTIPEGWTSEMAVDILMPRPC
jgi:hypothetical protein